MPREAVSSAVQANISDFAKTAESQAQDAMAVQRELWNLMEETRKHWLGLVEQDTQLASELMTNLSSSKSLPEMAKAYQDWMAARINLMTQESHRMFASGQKFMSSTVTMVGKGVPTRP